MIWNIFGKWESIQDRLYSFALNTSSIHCIDFHCPIYLPPKALYICLSVEGYLSKLLYMTIIYPFCPCKCRLLHVEIDTCGFNLLKVAKVLVEAYAKMIFVHGFVHGDPHPGNILVSVDAKQGFCLGAFKN